MQYDFKTELKNKNSLLDDTSQKFIEITNASKRLNHLSTQTLNKITGADLC